MHFCQQTNNLHTFVTKYVAKILAIFQRKKAESANVGFSGSIYSGWMGILRKCTKLDIWIFRYFDIKLGSNWDGEDEDLRLFGLSGQQWKLLRNW